MGHTYSELRVDQNLICTLNVWQRERLTETAHFDLGYSDFGKLCYPDRHPALRLSILGWAIRVGSQIDLTIENS